MEYSQLRYLDEGMGVKFDILIYTHSSYSDVFDVFLTTMKNNIKDLNEFKLVVVTNSTSTESVLVSNQIQNFILVEYNDTRHYSSHFEGLKDVISNYFLYLQDDYFITGNFKFSNLDHFVNLISVSGISFFRLTSSGAQRSKAYFDYYKNRSRVRSDNKVFLRIDYLSALPACMQPTIWKTDDFLLMHKEASVENLREEWSPKYRECFKNHRLIGWASVDVSIPYLEVTAVRKGKWNFTDYKWGLVLVQILLSKGINPLERGLTFYKHRVKERKSTIFHDIWRRIRYSR